MPGCFGQGPPFSEQQLHLLLFTGQPCCGALIEDWIVGAVGGALPNTQLGG